MNLKITRDEFIIVNIGHVIYILYYTFTYAL